MLLRKSKTGGFATGRSRPDRHVWRFLDSKQQAYIHCKASGNGGFVVGALHDTAVRCLFSPMVARKPKRPLAAALFVHSPYVDRGQLVCVARVAPLATIAVVHIALSAADWSLLEQAATVCVKAAQRRAHQVLTYKLI
jgi:hypothetical protein